MDDPLREALADAVAAIDIHDRSGWEVSAIIAPLIDAAISQAVREALTAAADELDRYKGSVLVCSLGGEEACDAIALMLRARAEGKPDA